MAPTAMLAPELPARASLFAGLMDLAKTQGPGPGSDRRGDRDILQLLITLGQSEAPPGIVQAPEGPDVTVVVPDDHPGAGATGVGSLDP